AFAFATVVVLSGCARHPIPAAAPTPSSPTAEQLAAQRQAAANTRLRNDWADLGRYAKANAALPPPAANEQRVVFLGNSITDGWAKFFPVMFAGKPYIGRGISGQTTPQMLVRFRQDVVALKPAAVVI